MCAVAVAVAAALTRRSLSEEQPARRSTPAARRIERCDAAEARTAACLDPSRVGPSVIASKCTAKLDGYVSDARVKGCQISSPHPWWSRRRSHRLQTKHEPV